MYHARLRKATIMMAASAKKRCFAGSIHRLIPNMTLHSALVIITIFLASINLVNAQINIYCPLGCTCDDQNLQVTCNQPFGGSGLPHILNPSTRKISTNSAHMNSLVGTDSLKDLEMLDIALNKYTTINFEAFKNNPQLTTLNASHNIINKIGDTVVNKLLDSIGINEAIVFERLNQTKITYLNLVSLYLSNNKLTTVRSFSFVGFPKLEKLDLSHNSITNLEPYSLFGLQNLLDLNIRANRLTQIPTSSFKHSIGSLVFSRSSSRLNHLDLSENHIERVNSDAFYDLSGLVKLNLNSNNIHTIERRGFNGLNNLFFLSMANNSLDQVPKTAFQDIIQLKYLQLSANPLDSIPPTSFEYLQNLEELYLNNATFHEITSKAFLGLKSLKRLEISFNQNLTMIESHTFSNLTALTYLNLHANSLSTLNDDFKASFSPNLVLDVRENSLQCDCNLKWLTRWLRNFADNYQNRKTNISLDDVQMLLLDYKLATDLMNISCSGPPFFKDKLIIDLPDNKLECLTPDSDLNLKLSFAILYLLLTIITVICTFSFCNNKHHLTALFNENPTTKNGGMSMMLSYKQKLHKNCDDLKKETQLYTIDHDPHIRNNSMTLEDTFFHQPPSSLHM